jgi:hypothetical protein
LIQFLKSGVLKPPQAVTDAPPPNARHVGFIVPNFDEGSLLLKNAQGQFFRLSWEKKTENRRRALPPGDYHLMGYRIVRRDAKGDEWFISVTARGTQRVTVRAGQEQPVEVSETITVQCRAKPGGAGVEVQMMIMDKNQSGLSIYRNGKRIPMRYTVTDAQGKEVASGMMNYG